jgi:hypothetical protein
MSASEAATDARLFRRVPFRTNERKKQSSARTRRAIHHCGRPRAAARRSHQSAGPPRGDRSRPSSSGWQRGRCVRPAPKKAQASTRPVSGAPDTPFRTHDVAMPVRLHAKRFRKCVDTGQSRHEEAKGTSGRCWRATSKNKRLPLFAVRCGPHGSAASSVTPYHRESPPHPRH